MSPSSKTGTPSSAKCVTSPNPKTVTPQDASANQSSEKRRGRPPKKKFIPASKSVTLGVTLNQEIPVIPKIFKMHASKKPKLTGDKIMRSVTSDVDAPMSDASVTPTTPKMRGRPRKFPGITYFLKSYYDPGALTLKLCPKI
jgi:hypothetical protein